ncbi:MAG: hypothetical protein GC134_07540 [Proteobacteria bacterium]|nr:hypothetical protein [Pseudomonadota bacterium]
MFVCYAQKPLPQQMGGIFLAGPTPRSAEVPSWRPQALALLREKGYTGPVYVPEEESGQIKGDYMDQIQWEWACLEAADVVLFWVPRELVTMPAFTTNVEFGMYADSGKVVLGYPEGAPKMRYLHALADRFGVPVHHDLEETLTRAVAYQQGQAGKKIRAAVR